MKQACAPRLNSRSYRMHRCGGSGALRSNCYSDRNLQIADSLSGVNNGIYSCRAECDIDIANFLAAATESRTEIEVRHRAVDPDDAFMSEMVLEFESPPASIDSLREIMRGLRRPSCDEAVPTAMSPPK